MRIIRFMRWSVVTKNVVLVLTVAIHRRIFASYQLRARCDSMPVCACLRLASSPEELVESGTNLTPINPVSILFHPGFLYKTVSTCRIILLKLDFKKDQKIFAPMIFL